MRRVKRVYYISPSRSALAYHRCTLPAYYLNRAGIAETAIDFSRFQKEFVDWADVVVIQRIVGQSMKHVIHYCHLKGKKVVFELDDNVWCFPDSPEYRSKEIDRVPEETADIINRCDALTVSTEGIARSAREKTSTPVFVLPNCMDFSRWRKMDMKRERLLVGWMGGHYHFQDLQMIVPGLKEILEKNRNVTLVFLGSAPMQLLIDCPERVFLQEFVGVEMLPKMMSVMGFDIGLAPLYETEFARSRSNIRLLQYSALEIPSVVNRWGEYGRMVDDGFLCLCVEDGNWSEAIQELIDDGQKRLEIGHQAYGYVVERYEIRDNIFRWRDVYEGL